MASPADLDKMLQDGLGRSDQFAQILVSRYYEYIHGLAVCILGSLSEADDACQETLIDALLHIDRYSPGTNLRAWLCKILVHKCQAALRRRKITSPWRSTIGNIEMTFRDSTSEAALQAERKGEVWSAVNSLKEKERIPVILYYVYDLKIREIATILDIPEGTVSSRLYYAVRKLRAGLGDIEED